jgi:hypothetical protein
LKHRVSLIPIGNQPPSTDMVAEHLKTQKAHTTGLHAITNHQPSTHPLAKRDGTTENGCIGYPEKQQRVESGLLKFPNI